MDEPGVDGTRFGEAAEDYARFRAGFPRSLFERLARFGMGHPDHRVLDVGTGTGTLARGFARRGCQVVGVDPDPRMLEQARRLDAEAGLAIRYVQGTAEATGLEEASFDVVAAGQCWHWLNRQTAAREAIRVLKPQGKLVIAYLDWLPLSDNVVETTEGLLSTHCPCWDRGGGVGLHPEWLPGLAEMGFRALETFSYDVDLTYTHEAWRGRVRASAPVVALDPPARRAFDSDLERTLAKRYPQDPLPVRHRIFAIVARPPGG